MAFYRKLYFTFMKGLDEIWFFNHFVLIEKDASVIDSFDIFIASTHPLSPYLQDIWCA